MAGRGKWLANAIYYSLMVLSAAIFLIPLFWMATNAIRPEYEIVQQPARWIPKTFSLVHFQYVLSRFHFLRWMFNSLWVALAATTLVVILDAMAAFALARFEFTGRRFIFNLILSMLLVPIQVGIVPLFLLMAQLHWLDTYTALILPTCANVTGVFLLRQFFANIPKELEEAAYIDGASPFLVWWAIILPLARPALAAVAAITFVSSWNSFLWPLIVANSDEVKTLPVGVAQFMSASSGTSGSAPAYGPPLAGAMMATLPALLAFLILQRYFVQGITSSGVKG